MVRLWSQEVGDAGSAIEPLVREVMPNAGLEIKTGKDLGVTTAEVIVTRGERKARCIVTFEAWEKARHSPEQMRGALRQIDADLEGSAALPAYLLTSRGLDTAAADKDSLVLGAIAHGIEADILAERFFQQGLRR